jgi:hypothetical protein
MMIRREPQPRLALTKRRSGCLQLALQLRIVGEGEDVSG